MTPRPTPRRSPLGPVTLCLWMALFTATAQASLREEVEAAYAGLSSYRARVDVELSDRQGRSSLTQRTDFYVAFDRPSRRLLVDAAGWKLLLTGARVQIVVEQAPGGHVDVMLPKMGLNDLLQAANMLKDPMPPDVLMLLGSLGMTQGELDTWTRMSTGRWEEQTEPVALLTAALPQSVMRVQLDPGTRLIARTETLSPPQSANATPPPQERRITCTITPLAEPMTPTDWEIVPARSQAHPSLAALFQSLASRQAPAANRVGQDAPATDLVNMNGEVVSPFEGPAKVVVLDFWATWCPPCRKSLPMLDRVRAQLLDAGHPVAIYAVNLEETPQEVQNFIDQTQLQTPVLMDTRGRTASAYGVQAIPTTVIIVDGKIASVHEGLNPTYEQDLLTEIQGMLAEKAGP